MRVAVLGATGAVGRTMLQVLAERHFAVDELVLLASSRSAGTELDWGRRHWPVRAVSAEAFDGVDLALFSAGSDRSREWAPVAAKAGAIVIDNSSAWRNDPQVPLVVPEVNRHTLAQIPLGIVANPNCSTIQLVVALAPLQRAAGLRSVLVTTFQAASGAGEAGRAVLRAEAAGQHPESTPFRRRLACNVIPQIGDLDGEGWSTEERKMRCETRKILDLPQLAAVATCVRVPVEVGHSVQVAAELDHPLSAAEAAEVLCAAPGLRFAAEADAFPTPAEIAGQDATFVGRLRVDPDRPATLHFWVVADNLRKGAATNAVQIAEVIAGGD